eukprot:m.110099 g.110099  ORF g.110099 m.110099 type:complete len:53 (-) comp16970_c0_seq3:276-434(-)
MSQFFEVSTNCLDVLLNICNACLCIRHEGNSVYTCHTGMSERKSPGENGSTW